MKTVDLSYFIERYNANEMNEDEKAWFREELKENKTLQEEVALRKKADMVIKDHDIIHLRSKLSAIEKKRAEAIPVKNNRKHLPLYRAAVIAGIILAGSLAFLSTRKLDKDEVFDRFYKSYESSNMTANTRSTTATPNTGFSDANDYYNIRDYRNAALGFSKVLSTDPRYMESIMLYGMSKFEEKNYSEAERSFTKVIEDNYNYFVEDAQWYLALCYLKTGELEKETEQLKLIKRSGNIYSKDAGKILRRQKK